MTDIEVKQLLAIDELEIQLTAHRRAVTAAIRMLDDARHALNNGSPHVTDEYLDRTLTALLKLTLTTAR